MLELEEGLIYIYAIVSLSTSIAYIGSSELPRFRLKEHIKKLAHNKHDNINLQEAYDSGGILDFDFLILDSCAIDDRSMFEYGHINSWGATYNIIKSYKFVLLFKPEPKSVFTENELEQIRRVWR